MAILADHQFLVGRRRPQRSLRRTARGWAKGAFTLGGAVTGLALAQLSYRLAPQCRDEDEDFERFLRRHVGTQRLNLLEVPTERRGRAWRLRDRLTSLFQTFDFMRFSLGRPRNMAALHETYAEIFGPVYPFGEGFAFSDFEDVSVAAHCKGLRRTSVNPISGETEAIAFTGRKPALYLHHLLIPHFLDADDPRWRVARDLLDITMGAPRKYPKTPDRLLEPIFNAEDTSAARKQPFLGAYLAVLWFKCFEVELTLDEMERLEEGIRQLAVVAVLPSWIHDLVGDGVLLDPMDDHLEWTKRLLRERSGAGFEALRRFCEDQSPGCQIPVEMGLQSVAGQLLIAGGATAIERMYTRLETNMAEQVASYRRTPEGWVREILRHETPVVRTSTSFTAQPVAFESRDRPYTLPAGSVSVASLARAHHDPLVFPDGDRFDPHRDQSNTLCFHAREALFQEPGAVSTTAARACPGRDIALSTLLEISEVVVDSFEAGLPTGR